ncbi:hypothetical protein [Streptomyces sp. LaPpAH-108]|uniref:hypothetical protein n=1 Tax=Streptomyces sp. LaPpAH-108 TaxID=1155714 RepID=UPI0003761DE3|nr:hypothetical protein [Streptomyces sp. LaPpAH-108]
MTSDTAMTKDTEDSTGDTREWASVRVVETGWARARRLRGQRVRTCVAAVVTKDSAPRTGAEENIVRGED